MLIKPPCTNIGDMPIKIHQAESTIFKSMSYIMFGGPYDGEEFSCNILSNINKDVIINSYYKSVLSGITAGVNGGEFLCQALIEVPINNAELLVTELSNINNDETPDKYMLQEIASKYNGIVIDYVDFSDFDTPMPLLAVFNTDQTKVYLTDDIYDYCEFTGLTNEEIIDACENALNSSTEVKKFIKNIAKNEGPGLYITGIVDLPYDYYDYAFSTREWLDISQNSSFDIILTPGHLHKKYKIKV